jgi:hypothetical protein
VEKGERMGYFQSDVVDAKKCITDLVREERLAERGDLDANYADSIARQGKKFKSTGTDEQFDSMDYRMEEYEISTTTSTLTTLNTSNNI